MLERSVDDVLGHAPGGLAATLVRLSSSRASAPAGEPLALAAQVRTLRAGVPAPTGSVEFKVAGRLLGTAALDTAGQGVLDGVRLTPGVHAITAWYGGDAQHAAASSTPFPQAVMVLAAPVVVLVSAPVAGPDGVQLEAELVDPHSGRLAEDATGCLVFTAGTTTLATADLVAGRARALVRRLPAGRLKAVFAGDSEHAAATGTHLDHASGT